jgi:hypothetical protein
MSIIFPVMVFSMLRVVSRLFTSSLRQERRKRSLSR